MRIRISIFRTSAAGNNRHNPTKSRITIQNYNPKFQMWQDIESVLLDASGAETIPQYHPHHPHHPHHPQQEEGAPDRVMRPEEAFQAATDFIEELKTEAPKRAELLLLPSGPPPASRAGQDYPAPEANNIQPELDAHQLVVNDI